MATTATRIVSVQFEGDVESVVQQIKENVQSPGVITVQTLASGTNAIVPPANTNLVPIVLTIIPPAGNATAIVVKGVSGDTGLSLHPEYATSLAVSSTTTSFLLVVDSTIQGVRLVWS